VSFDPGLSVGDTITNEQLTEVFGVRNMGGMRRSRANNLLVLVADFTQGLYLDKWIKDVLHLTGIGQVVDQDIADPYNALVAGSKTNGVDLHLFQVIKPTEYIYCGRAELAEDPYTEKQPDANGNNRQVWVFPVKPITTMAVPKPDLLVFSDKEDCLKRGKAAERAYVLRRDGLRGHKVRHKTHGMGTVKEFDGTIIRIGFDNGKEADYIYDKAIQTQSLALID
jgi:5-methylcytosine-specific restriction protein A